MDPLDPRRFENLHPGRRTIVNLSVSPDERVTIAVLDSPTIEWVEVSCAAMLVPTGEEDDWIYGSEGGQWQLLAAAGVSRMVIVQRNLALPGTDRIGTQIFGDGSGAREISEGHRPTRVDNASCLQCEDEALKTRLRYHVIALAPRICFRSGIPVVPFVDYTSNVIHRVIVEELDSSLTGEMVVEDVALDNLDSEPLESEECVPQSISQNEDLLVLAGGTGCPHKLCSRGRRKLDRVSYRRRLRFKRMPNLIQTEVPLVMPQNLRASRMKMAGDVDVDTRIGKESVGALCEDVISGLQIDDSWLVHKYLPPIVAGLVLASNCIETCMERGEKAKVLALGVGGGALPIFLQKHLGFHVQAVDVDRAVLDLAHRHFGLNNGDDMKVEVGDALQVVGELAMRVIAEATLNSPYPTSEEMVGKSLHCTSSCTDCVNMDHQTNRSKSELDDHRVHVIILDVDEGDARCGLSSPPSRFLEHKFLTAVRTVLHEGGLLAVNVVPNGAKSYRGVVSLLLSVFDDVYETTVGGDVNRVVFALPSTSRGVNLDGPLACLVKKFLDVRCISAIQKVHIERWKFDTGIIPDLAIHACVD